MKSRSIVRGGYLHWSLTWDDLNPAFGGTSKDTDLLRAPKRQRRPPNDMKAVQGQFDARWSVGPLRSKLRHSSFELLLEYLAKPDLERWKQAVFTDLLRVFDQSRMADSQFGDRFRDAAEECLPLQAVDSIDELDDPRYVAGRGGLASA